MRHFLIIAYFYPFQAFPIISLLQIITIPGVAFIDPRGTVDRIYKKDYYLYIINALCLVVSEKKLFFTFFPIVRLWDLMTPRLGPFFDPSGLVRIIYVKLNITMMHAKYTSVGVEDFSCISHYKPRADDAPRAGPLWNPGNGWQNIHCYTQNIFKSSGPCGF